MRIDGGIGANGQVILTSPAGFEIGGNARLDAAGLELDGGASQILNGGSLTGRGGDIVLRGAVIQQLGTIKTTGGDSGPSAIRLEAGRELHLGPNSRLRARGAEAHVSNGGRVWLKAGERFCDETGSQIDVRGGDAGGDGGVVNLCAAQVSAIRSRLDASARPGWRGGSLSIDPVTIVLSNGGSDSIGPGTVSAGDGPSTLRLSVNSAFVGFSHIHLEAAGDILLDTDTVWNLNGSTGISDPGSQLTLEAGRNIVFADTAQLLAGAGWSVRLAAGVNFASPQHSITMGVGGVYLNGGPPDLAGFFPNGRGSLQTSDGSISLEAGHEVLIGAGFVRTVGVSGGPNGGNIDIRTGDGDVDAGTNPNWYQFSRTAPGYSIGPLGLGGIGTAHGGNVTINSGRDILSFIPTVGAFEAGDVTLTAVRTIIGKCIVRGGRGTIQAGVGLGTASSPATLELVSGGWDVQAPDIYLNEVLNPNGVFNNNLVGAGTDRVRFRFDYAPDAHVHLAGANSVQLLGSSLSHVAENPDRPPIYPPQLAIQAGAGGVVLGNDVILYPSASGQLQVTTTDGGSLRTISPNFSQLVASDSGSKDYKDFATGHASSPLHLADPDPASLMINGDLQNIFIRSPKRTDITVAGDALNFGFEGQNLSPNDVSHLTIAGDYLTRSDRTFAVLSDAPSQAAFAHIFVDPLFVAYPQLAARLTYNAATQALGYQGRMTPADRDFLLHPVVLSRDQSGSLRVDANGNPLLDPVVFTTDAAAINALYANSQDIPASALAYAGVLIGGPGGLAVSARNLDLGISKGIRSVGLLLNPALAAVSFRGADLNISLTGDLRMSLSQIASHNGGNIDLDVRGQSDIGDDSISSVDTPVGIYTAHGGHVTLRSGGDAIVRGSRVATYDGGDLTVLAGRDVDAGAGGNGFFTIVTAQFNPATGQLETRNDRFFGSGILAVTRPDSAAVVGNIVVNAQRDVLSGCTGISQISFNSADVSKAFVQVVAGREILLEPSCGVLGINVDLRAGTGVGAILEVRSESTNVTAVAGAQITLAVTAIGLSPISYQWAKDGTNLPGATSPQLSLPSVQQADAGRYSVVVMNPWAMKTNDIQLVVLDARGIAESVLADLISLRASSTSKEDRAGLAQIIRDLTQSLRSHLWLDQTHLRAKHGKQVFDEWKDAVNRLRDLMKDKKSRLPDAVLQDFIDRIVRASRLLAVTGIEDLANAGANSEQLADAKKDLAKGDRSVSRGKPEEGIESYRDSWEDSAGSHR